ncbi:MAG TPA: DUF72 domain-containing protein [Acidimicrobiales bacterium]|jgi:uncharacterized protein YecE (DUF72 family)|nr:DUF72 domain-containing protein [Acidimicrobiales bacterium]
MPVLIGTSGWQYRDWRGRFYPVGLAQARWLEHYAARFRTVEVNNAFYRLPEAGTFEAWKDRTPDDFIVSVKASRYLTHIRRLREPAEPVHRLMSRADHLGPKLGPVLLQLPGNFRVNLEALDETLSLFPSGTRIAFEPRHDSWHRDETADLLSRHHAAFCLSDAPGRRSPRWRTADWGYLRLHAGRATPAPCYGRTALRSWAERLAERWTPDEDVYVYFNNDHRACAVRDAHRFASAVERVGLRPSRVPSAREVRVGAGTDDPKHDVGRAPRTDVA